MTNDTIVCIAAIMVDVVAVAVLFGPRWLKNYRLNLPPKPGVKSTIEHVEHQLWKEYTTKKLPYLTDEQEDEIIKYNNWEPSEFRKARRELWDKELEEYDKQ
jgi:hypothetical protein